MKVNILIEYFDKNNNVKLHEDSIIKVGKYGDNFINGLEIPGYELLEPKKVQININFFCRTFKIRFLYKKKVKNVQYNNIIKPFNSHIESIKELTINSKTTDNKVENNNSTNIIHENTIVNSITSKNLIIADTVEKYFPIEGSHSTTPINEILNNEAVIISTTKEDINNLEVKLEFDPPIVSTETIGVNKFSEYTIDIQSLKLDSNGFILNLNELLLEILNNENVQLINFPQGIYTLNYLDTITFNTSNITIDFNNSTLQLFGATDTISSLITIGDSCNKLTLKNCTLMQLNSSISNFPNKFQTHGILIDGAKEIIITNFTIKNFIGSAIKINNDINTSTEKKLPENISIYNCLLSDNNIGAEINSCDTINIESNTFNNNLSYDCLITNNKQIYNLIFTKNTFNSSAKNNLTIYAGYNIELSNNKFNSSLAFYEGIKNCSLLNNDFINSKISLRFNTSTILKNNTYTASNIVFYYLGMKGINLPITIFEETYNETYITSSSHIIIQNSTFNNYKKQYINLSGLLYKCILKNSIIQNATTIKNSTLSDCTIDNISNYSIEDSSLSDCVIYTNTNCSNFNIIKSELKNTQLVVNKKNKLINIELQNNTIITESSSNHFLNIVAGNITSINLLSNKFISNSSKSLIQIYDYYPFSIKGSISVNSNEFNINENVILIDGIDLPINLLSFTILNNNLNRGFLLSETYKKFLS